jgi:hypothetical protein
MARSWTSLGKQLGTLAARQAVVGSAKVVGQLQQNGMIPRTLGVLVTDVITPPRPAPPRRLPAKPGRPVASVLRPTGQRARRVVYSPDLAGRARAGEVVWTWIEGHPELDDGDHPVLVVGREGDTLLALVVSTSTPPSDDPRWVDIGVPNWQHTERHWVRTDGVLDVPEAGIRREGAVLDRACFDRVAEHLCVVYRWR